MINIKTNREIDSMKKAGKIVYETHQYLKPFIKEGITTKELDTLAEEFILGKGGIPSCKGYQGFPATLCISVNEEVVHGIPGSRVLKNGDVVSIDICVSYEGYHGDSAWSYRVGKVDEEKEYLLKYTEEALYAGLSKVKPGNKIGDISNAIERVAKKHNLGIVRELVGHGVGKHLHEKPDIPNYGKENTGYLIKEGMVFAIEPMLTLGGKEIVVLDDGWTIETYDKSPAAHFEHTVVVTKDGYQILTGE